MRYNNTWYGTVCNYNNANVVLAACGGGLYIGYNNTTTLYFYTGST